MHADVALQVFAVQSVSGELLQQLAALPCLERLHVTGRWEVGHSQAEALLMQGSGGLGKPSTFPALRCVMARWVCCGRTPVHKCSLHVQYARCAHATRVHWHGGASS